MAMSQDPKYYFCDGNVIFEVESTLFKVHQSIISKDNSVFENLFSHASRFVTPGNTVDSKSSGGLVLCGNGEGETDESPIRLHGDSVGEFRALLWSLYALPGEIARVTQMNSANFAADEQKVILLARIAHKYHFTSTEEWALSILTTYEARPGIPISIENLTHLSELAVLCSNPTLLELSTMKWKGLVGEGMDLAAAINIAEKLDLQELLGLAYHAMMLQGRDAWESNSQLNRLQRIRLLSGYYTISNLCQALPSTPPLLPHDPGCVHRARCGNAWISLWKIINDTTCGIGGQVLKLAAADLLGRVMLAESVMKALVERHISGTGLLDSMSPKCLGGALKATRNKVQEVKRELPGWFSDIQ